VSGREVGVLFAPSLARRTDNSAGPAAVRGFADLTEGLEGHDEWRKSSLTIYPTLSLSLMMMARDAGRLAVKAARMPFSFVSQTCCWLAAPILLNLTHTTVGPKAAGRNRLMSVISPTRATLLKLTSLIHPGRPSRRSRSRSYCRFTIS